MPAVVELVALAEDVALDAPPAELVELLLLLPPHAVAPTASATAIAQVTAIRLMII
ncbi:MAG TPA: hypothetical protein VFW09_04055 [Solirubrobacteraceae bacterium]|nr:hypothetical protein [Solirubrobacteraceae bacterium]